jgi:hypothetical protein
MVVVVAMTAAMTAAMTFNYAGGFYQYKFHSRIFRKLNR